MEQLQEYILNFIRMLREQKAWFYDWKTVGQLHVKVRNARDLTPAISKISGLLVSGIIPIKNYTYIIMELDNIKVETSHSLIPEWEEQFIFDVADVTSLLEVSAYNESHLHPQGEFLGRVSIPLLWINNGQDKWYALKDKNNKTYAKGNCSRVLLQMHLLWNPVKASVRVFSPKEVNPLKINQNFNINMIYNNLKFIGDLLVAIKLINEHFKYLFEWEDRKLSFLALSAWLTFWYLCRPWMIPLVMILPFLYQWLTRVPVQKMSTKKPSILVLGLPTTDDDLEQDLLEFTGKDEPTLKKRVLRLQDLTFTIKNGIDYTVSSLERLKNLLNFVVPYLSFLAILFLLVSAVILYFVPGNYLYMAFGIYKFLRKSLDPDRVPNNDILDFLSRVPNDDMLKQWRELKVTDFKQSIVKNTSARRMTL